MKAGLFAFAMLLMTAGASHAGGLVTRHQSSLQHTVDPTRTITSRTANSYAISGSGVSLDVDCLLYTSPSPRDRQKSRMPSSA